MNQTHTLRNLAAALLSKLRFIVICAVLFGAAAFCAAWFWMPVRYEAQASVYVRGNGAESENAAGVRIAVLSSRAFMREVSERLASSSDAQALREAFPGADAENPPDVSKALRVSAADGADVINLAANTANPEISARICNIAAEIAPSYLTRIAGDVGMEVIDKAVPVYKPVSPNVPLVTAIGLCVGLCFAVALSLALDFFDDTVRDTEKLSKTFSKPILGEIQNADADDKNARMFWKGFSFGKRRRRRRRSAHYRHTPSGHGSRRSRRKLITDENIPFNVVEGYKSIRTNIVFALGTAPRKIVVISGAGPREGKSTTAANVALAFSQISERVLLIDADMRKPVQHRTFVADNSTGLSTLIISLSTIEDSIRRHVSGNLDLLPSGPIPPNPSELLGSEQFRELLETLSQRYDYMIIDTPPVNVVSDALVVQGAGGIMLVARYAQTTYEEVAEAMKKIALAGANMLGFTLNDVEHTAGRYRYGRYGYYYGYGYGYAYAARRNREAESAAPDANAALRDFPGAGNGREREGL